MDIGLLFYQVIVAAEVYSLDEQRKISMVGSFVGDELNTVLGYFS
jgi:hypothetical protein